MAAHDAMHRDMYDDMHDDVDCELDMPELHGVAQRLAFGHPSAVYSARRVEEVVDVLAAVERQAKAGSWCVGYVAYEAAPAFDPGLICHEPVDGLPLAMFAVFPAPVVPQLRSAPSSAGMWGAWRDTAAPGIFDAEVAAIQRDIVDGRFYQVNYTTRLRAPWFGGTRGLFDALRNAQPHAYSAYLDFGRWQICSVSPELFFEFQPVRGPVPPTLSFRPMKGTAARPPVPADDPAADCAAADALRASVKDRAENLMIVDLLRNDASRVAELGSVRVPRLFDVEAWTGVWQMTSTIECQPRPAVGLADIFGAVFPCGSVTGAPKAEAMRAIGEIESSARGVYCGAIGVVLPGGAARFNVAIRTVVVDRVMQMAECGIGSGIVADSTIDGERDEWRMKQGFLQRACPDYELYETLLWRRGRYWLLDEHLARLTHSASVLGFRFDRAAALTRLTSAAQGFGSAPMRVRLRLTMAGAIEIDSDVIEVAHGPVRCVIATESIDSADPWLRHKTSRRERYAVLGRPGFFDTLLYNERNEVTEFTRGNLVARIDGKLLTPQVDCGLLPGSFRAALMSRGVVQAAVLKVGDLRRADRLWFINSVRASRPVELLA